ncbi:hypothetical protein [Shewanella sp. YIC-542]|uniref:hypothetical protein n=1 Tax=Shewanella mytili TaxID=3377111 RepID=UPI00398EBEFE
MKKLFSPVVSLWHKYTAWCDRMGLTEDNRRCCMPRLQDPPLDSTPQAKKVPAQGGAKAKPNTETK